MSGNIDIFYRKNASRKQNIEVLSVHLSWLYQLMLRNRIVWQCRAINAQLMLEKFSTEQWVDLNSLEFIRRPKCRDKA